ncbi:hypothetical protein CLOHYLEM_05484 [[Clostridium] hylemonae DSM 15053]|uniref:Uncharacterized protein n=1 Tax=[Clostridium] hylemonae DSM 15053 TaxID=553973 RepID=C0C090_9FIRM|nr:hypothetical protein CLOHYLEM_05484 [[Clostridium] hylemonae DSM 15053]
MGLAYGASDHEKKMQPVKLHLEKREGKSIYNKRNLLSLGEAGGNTSYICAVLTSASFDSYSI